MTTCDELEELYNEYFADMVLFEWKHIYLKKKIPVSYNKWNFCLTFQMIYILHLSLMNPYYGSFNDVPLKTGAEKIEVPSLSKTLED